MRACVVVALADSPYTSRPVKQDLSNVVDLFWVLLQCSIVDVLQASGAEAEVIALLVVVLA